MSRQQPQLHSYLWRCTAYSLQQGISQHLLCWISWPSGKQLPQQEQQDSLTSGGVSACASEQHSTARHLRALSGLISSTDKQALLVRQSTARRGCCWHWDDLLRGAPGAALGCAECPWHCDWAPWASGGIIPWRVGTGKLSFQLVHKIFYFRQCVSVMLHLLQVREAEGRKLKQVLAESCVMVP